MLGAKQGGDMLSVRRQRGFSLVELLIAIVIIGILLALGVPSFKTYMANQKIRSTAETFMAGIQRARGEAVAQNVRVQILLTNDNFLADASATPPTPNFTPTPSATGKNWVIFVLDATGSPVQTQVPATTGPYIGFIEGKMGIESTGTAPFQVDGNGVNSIAFDGFGTPTVWDATASAWTPMTATATFAFSHAFVPSPEDAALMHPEYSCKTTTGGGPIRCLNVRVSRGGQVRLCDPALASTDTRSCS